VLHLDAPVTVTFTNQDSVEHRMEQAPELAYGDCPEMDKVGTLKPGRTGSVTVTRTAVICAYHDADRPTDMAFKGILVVH
jgi:hypothetical protein